jgi:hypothetical protein
VASKKRVASKKSVVSWAKNIYAERLLAKFKVWWHQKSPVPFSENIYTESPLYGFSKRYTSAFGILLALPSRSETVSQ